MKRELEVVKRPTNKLLYEDKGTGLIMVDWEAMTLPENQVLLRALYEQQERGAATPQPHEIFPIMEAPQELLLDMIGDDARVFRNLALSTQQMKQRLLPLAPRFVCKKWPDVALLLWMACDTALLQKLTRLVQSQAYGSFKGSKYYLMGFSEYDEFWEADLERDCGLAIESANIAELSTVLRYHDGFKNIWQAYNLFLSQSEGFGTIMYTFGLLPAHYCRHSQIAAIKLVTEILDVAHRLQLTWRMRNWPRKPERSVRFASFKKWLKLSPHLLGPGTSPYKMARGMASELCDALTQKRSEDSMYEFEGIETLAESEAYSIDAAHLTSMLEQYDKEVKVLLQRTGMEDPLYVDIIPVDILANQICLMVKASDCGQFWLKIMENMELKPGLNDESDHESSAASIDAPYRCVGCRTAATRFDTTFRLPFCPKDRCLGTTFTKLQACGLYRK